MASAALASVSAPASGTGGMTHVGPVRRSAAMTTLGVGRALSS